ncbi:MAG: helix-turn-helix domain-containing protein [Croceivirga sp.]|mgnify:FL=1
MEEDFISVKPKNDVLSNVIDFYYFQKIQNNGTYSVIYYPNYNTGLNHYYHADVDIQDEGRYLSETQKKGTDCYITQNTKSARYVTVHGSIRKLGIMFKPLGINHFIEGDLVDLAPDPVSPFNYFGHEFLNICNSLNPHSDLSETLDDFFSKRYLGFEDVAFKNLIESILETDGDLFVQNFASAIGVTRKTIFRKFRKHLCTSPSDFIALVKFRKALNHYNLNAKLSEIAYESHYYDQSNFIKQFKKIAGLTPKATFEKIVRKGDFQILWTNNL